MTAIPQSTLPRSLSQKPVPRKAGLFAGQERWLTLGAAVFALVSALAVLAQWRIHGYPLVDMVVYRAEGRSVLDHTSLYGMRVAPWHLAATYPPFAALLFVPAAWLPVSVMRWIVMGENLMLVGVLACLSCRLAAWPRPRLRPAVALLSAGAGLWLEPIWTTLKYGQINLLLVVLVLWDLLRPDDRRSKGVAIGIAIGIKLTPGVFAVHLLLTRRIRAGLVALATSLVTVLLGYVALPGASFDFWTKDLYDTGRVGRTWIVDNQSLSGLVARLLHTPQPGLPATIAAVVVGVTGLAVAAFTARRAADPQRAGAWGIILCAVTGLLASPISWTHHWVWCLPLLVLLSAEAAREARAARGQRRLGWRITAVAVWIAFASKAMWRVNGRHMADLHLPYWKMLCADIYPLLGLALLAVAAARLLGHGSAVNLEGPR
ncbi:glycosyltransferase 87 family protein [Streptacidiphilus sp. EB103A]|uniref:glycosyltransferase 87 family protein n=1 Tax=Streptacidiphilus sp. EB103A TaxID=3156275 RepID=UPI003518A32C